LRVHGWDCGICSEIHRSNNFKILYAIQTGRIELFCMKARVPQLLDVQDEAADAEVAAVTVEDDQDDDDGEQEQQDDQQPQQQDDQQPQQQDDQQPQQQDDQQQEASEGDEEEEEEEEDSDDDEEEDGPEVTAKKICLKLIDQHSLAKHKSSDGMVVYLQKDTPVGRFYEPAEANDEPVTMEKFLCRCRVGRRRDHLHHPWPTLGMWHPRIRLSSRMSRTARATSPVRGPPGRRSHVGEAVSCSLRGPIMPAAARGGRCRPRAPGSRAAALCVAHYM
jgi:hypothetical protein